MAEKNSSVGLANAGLSAVMPVALVDSRIGDPATPIQEVVILTKVRGELITQDEHRLDRAEARTTKNRQFWGKFGLSIVAIGTGVVLISVGSHLEGFVILGVGFHWLAPDFVKMAYGRILGGKDKSDGE